MVLTLSLALSFAVNAAKKALREKMDEYERREEEGRKKQKR